MKVEGGKAVLVHVPHATDADGSWIVLGGLAPADVLALTPPDDVRNGDPIDVTAPGTQP